jgi:hypothetical protein
MCAPVKQQHKRRYNLSLPLSTYTNLHRLLTDDRTLFLRQRKVYVTDETGSVARLRPLRRRKFHGLRRRAQWRFNVAVEE